MAWKPLRVRLRDGKDDDIGKALEAAEKTEDRSDIVRAALRVYLCQKRPRTDLQLPQVALPLERKEKDDAELSADLDDLLSGL